jgi:hypothetical protein
MKMLWSFFLLGIPAAAGEVSVCILDGGLAPSVQSVARIQAVWMLSKAGVKVRLQARNCQIEIRFTNGTPATSHPGALAYAEPFAEGVQRITVLYDRVRFSAERRPGLEPRLLAHVMVHEIGHVLMRTDAHSDTGVMKAHWTADDYDQMVRVPLGFTAVERELLVIPAGERPSDAPRRRAARAR